MFIFLPDSPVSAPGLTPRERRIAVERLRENQTGVENKHLKPYQVLEAFMDYKLYIFFMLGCVCEYYCILCSHSSALICKATSPMAASPTSAH